MAFFVFWKKLFIGLIIFSLILLCFKGFLYRNLINYKEIDQRALMEIERKSIKDDLNDWLNTNKAATVEQLVDFATSYSTNPVSYTFGKCSIDPNQIITTDKKTNCIGYSATLHSVVTYLLDKKGWTSNVKSEHKVGQLYFLNFNVHRWFKNPAFKDHDYNVITDKEKKKIYNRPNN